MGKKIHLIRHGETDYNLQGIIQGRGVDAPLNANGQAQAEAFFRAYHKVPFEVILTSSMLRSQQTVTPFAELGIPVETFADIDEISWGDQEGQKPNPESVGAYRRMRAAWQKGQYDASVSNGESAAELRTRVSRFVEHLSSRTESQLLVCSHGRTIRCMMTVLCKMPLHQMDSFPHSNTGLYLIQYENESYQVLKENDTTHLSQ